MKNEVKITEICKKEEKLEAIREWLIVLFFVALVVVVLLLIKFINGALGADDSLAVQRVMVVNIILTLLSFAAAFVSGYFIDKKLSKKIIQLNEEKISLL